MTTREGFLSRVRQAVAAGNRAGQAPPLPTRGGVGYQGAGPDVVARLAETLAAAGATLHRVTDARAAADTVVELVQARSARRLLLGTGSVLDALGLAPRLRALRVTVDAVEALPEDGARPTFFAADIGISGVDHVVAETGTLVLRARPSEPRSLSLLPPVHIAVADRSQVLPDLFDLFGQLSPDDLPSCLSLITGPSKTGDIELRLVTGVHGPGEVHLVLIDVPGPRESM